jgi:hypothetical protein
VWWLAPPLMAAARLSPLGFLPVRAALITVDALVWTLVAVALHARIRRVPV